MWSEASVGNQERWMFIEGNVVGLKVDHEIILSILQFEIFSQR